MNKSRIVILAGGVSSRMKSSSTGNNSIDGNLLSDAEQKPKSMIRFGDEARPFLDYLILNIKHTGYTEVVLVINERDEYIHEYYSSEEIKKMFDGLEISFAYQKIPSHRIKPLGTADALYQALLVKPEWSGGKFSMCNSDNLYSVKALEMILDSEYSNAMIDYDRSSLGVEPERIEKFAVTEKDEEGFLIDIIEKPSKAKIDELLDKNGMVGVSMNMFSFSYDLILPFLESVPMNEERKEKELPAAVKMMIKENPKSLFCFPLKERVADLTNKNDILIVQNILKEEFGRE